MGDADQLHVGEHVAGTQAAIVQHGFDAALDECLVQRLGGLVDRGGGVLRVDHAHRHPPRRHRLGPDDARVVMALLDGGGDDAADPDAVATHGHHLGLAAFVDYGGAQGVGIFRPQLEHVAHFDAAGQVQFAVAVGRGIALDHVAQVGEDRKSTRLNSSHVEISYAVFCLKKKKKKKNKKKKYTKQK